MTCWSVHAKAVRDRRQPETHLLDGPLHFGEFAMNVFRCMIQFKS